MVLAVAVIVTLSASGYRMVTPGIGVFCIGVTVGLRGSAYRTPEALVNGRYRSLPQPGEERWP